MTIKRDASQNLQQSSDSSPTASIACQFSTLGVVRIAGEEAATFLQNLLINDIQAIKPNHAQLSGFCSPKGRLYAIFWVLKHTDKHFELIMPIDQISFIAQRLSMFKLRTQVDISSVQDRLVLGHSSPHPANSFEIDTARALSTISQSEIPFNTTYPVGDDTWQIQDILSGIPMVFEASREQFTAQQLNLDLIGGVSFRKGCYPGQEVIARLHYLGEPKRRMFAAKAITSICPQPNDDILAADGNVAGQIVQVQWQAEQQLLLQISLKLTYESTPLQLASGDLITDVNSFA